MEKLLLLENTGGINGFIRTRGREKLDLKNVALISKDKIVVVNVNAEGRIFVYPDQLLSKRGTRWQLQQSPDFIAKYDWKLNNHDKYFDEAVQKGSALSIPTVFSVLTNNKPAEVMKAGNGTKLREVVVKGKNEDERSTVGMGTVGCSSYICRYNILNCPNHPGDRGVPEEGMVYSSPRGPVVYRCLSAENFKIKNILIPKEFIATDFEKEEIIEPSFETTLYWNPNINTDSSGKATFSFFTNDLKGDFLIIAQGIDGKTIRPLYGKTGFSVK